MYVTVLFAHSWLRWVILLLVALVVVFAAARRGPGANGKTPAERFSVFAIIALDIQLLLGLLLYVFLTPHMANLLNNGAAVMHNKVLRYWSVEHVFGMIVVLALAHIGRVKIRKASTWEMKNKRALIWFGIVLLILVVTSPWPFMPYARPWIRM
jgi:hypothetical protein